MTYKVVSILPVKHGMSYIQRGHAVPSARNIADVFPIDILVGLALYNTRLTVIHHFPIGILGQVWYLILWIPDLCTLTYFHYSDFGINCMLVVRYPKKSVTIYLYHGSSSYHLPDTLLYKPVRVY